MKHIIIFILSGFFSIGYVMAEETQESSTPAMDTRELSPTQQWLEQQRSGKSASSQPQPLSGEAMDKVHKRYLKSFEKPIPEFYEHEMPIAR